MLNRVVLVGRLVADPEVRYTPAGIPVAQLRVAVNRITKNESGEYESDFFNVVAWRRTAEFAQNYLSKGRLVSIDGRLQTRSWVDQTSGQKRTAFEIVADNLEGLDRKGDGFGDQHAPVGDPGNEHLSAPVRTAQPPTIPPADDEHDPFADE